MLNTIKNCDEHFSTLQFDEDILRKLRTVYANANMLTRQFFMCNDIVKRRLFQSFFSTFYTAQLWWKYNVASIKKLIVAYNNSLRMFFNISRYESASIILAQRSVNGCSSIIRKLIYRFMQRLNCSENNIIKEIRKSDMIKRSDIWKHWASLLFNKNNDSDILTVT